MRHGRFAALVVAAAVLAGCTGVRKTTEGWWNEVTGSDTTSGATQQGSVYYAASDGLVVRADASPASPVVGRLAQYQRVVRTQLKNGWAYVAADGGPSGWVDNAQLVWRVPAQGNPPAAAPAAGQAPEPAPSAAPAEAAAPPAAVAPAPAPTAAPAPEAPPEPSPAPAPPPPQPTANKSQPSPDMFDPF